MTSPFRDNEVTMSDDREKSENWWRTSIIEVQPDLIRLRGYAIEELIGNTSFPGVIWLMMKGELPNAAQADLLGAALVAGVDHGPQAPSIAIARMAMTCGVGINGAIASAVNVLGDVHGGAGEQALEIYEAVLRRHADGEPIEQAADVELAQLIGHGSGHLPGFGHRFHKTDPRPPRLLALVDHAVADGHVAGKVAAASRALDAALVRKKGRRISMNIDGATAVIYGELGFPAKLARGLFVLSRSVGILAHAWEQSQQGGRNKGPIPRDYLWTYDGPPPRKLPTK